jgi:hypothetical protein
MILHGLGYGEFAKSHALQRQTLRKLEEKVLNLLKFWQKLLKC